MFFAPSSISIEERNRILQAFLRKDASVFTKDVSIQEKIRNRMGWLDVRSRWKEWLSACEGFLSDLRSRGVKNLVILGMGGSSLCSIVLNQIFGTKEGYLSLHVFDTIDPVEMDRLARLNPRETFILVASKSGSTIEPNSQYSFIYERYRDEVGDALSGHFGVITDPGSPLEVEARKKGFRHVFLNPEDIGGRYSALSLFGLVPAYCIGVDMNIFLSRAGEMMDRCMVEDWDRNPGAKLAEFMAENAIRNRDKLTFLFDEPYAPFGLWLEQLIAESTGKDTRGIVPILECSTGIPGYYGSERIFCYIRNRTTPQDKTYDDFIRELRASQFPVYEMFLGDAYDIAGQFYLWEFSTALSSVFLGVNPFDEPDVVLSKNKTKEIIKRLKETGALNIEFSIDPTSNLQFRVSKIMSFSKAGLLRSLREIFQYLPQWGYLGFLPYLPYDSSIVEIINEMRDLAKRERSYASVIGFGPRYLHSTGQIFKGGPISSSFIIFTRSKGQKSEYPNIPDLGIGFWELQIAQAIGDFEAMSELNKRVIHVHLPEDYIEGLKGFSKIFERAIMIS